MRNKVLNFTMFLLVFVFAIAGTALAHVSNELQVYKDLADSPAKEEITKLRAIGIIPYIEGQENFEPKAQLDKETLGTWLAIAAGIKGHTENPTPEEYAEEAVEYGLIDNLTGVATYKDVVTGLLKVIGVAEITAPAEQAVELGAIGEEWDAPVDSGAKANRQDAAILFDLFLTTNGPEGKSILGILGIKEGPVGTVDDVVEERVTVDGEEKEVFTLSINGTQFPFYGEGKIALYENILAAKGNAVVQSYLKTIEEEGKPAQEMVIFIQGDGSAAGTAVEQPANDAASASETPAVAEEEASETDVAAAEVEEEEGSGIPLGAFWTIAILLLLVVGLWVYISGNKKTV